MRRQILEMIRLHMLVNLTGIRTMNTWIILHGEGSVEIRTIKHFSKLKSGKFGKLTFILIDDYDLFYHLL